MGQLKEVNSRKGNFFRRKLDKNSWHSKAEIRRRMF